MRVTGWSLGTALSMSHIHGAAYFAKESYAIENDQHREVEAADADSRVLDHRANVMGAVFMSIAFLDAVINEECDLHADILTRSSHWAAASLALASKPKWKRATPNNPSDALERLTRKVPSPLDRIQAFLVLTERRPIDNNAIVYERAQSLYWLRNRLVHYESIWEEYPAAKLRPHRDTNLETLQEKLQIEFPAVNPLLPNAQWLYRVLNHACAEWAVRTAKDFVDLFYGQAGIPRPYDWSNLRLDTR